MPHPRTHTYAYTHTLAPKSPSPSVSCLPVRPHHRCSLPPSLPLHSYVSHHRGFWRKRDNAASPRGPLPSLPLPPCWLAQAGRKEGILAHLVVTRLCRLRASAATAREGGREGGREYWRMVILPISKYSNCQFEVLN